MAALNYFLFLRRDKYKEYESQLNNGMVSGGVTFILS
jgi:hypothetical protein